MTIPTMEKKVWGARVVATAVAATTNMMVGKTVSDRETSSPKVDIVV
jgi:anti-sigma-K factor RskA